jgi:hypothetical protein
VVPKTTVPVEGTLGSNPSLAANDKLLTEIDAALGEVWDPVKIEIEAEIEAEANACETCPKPGTCCTGFPLPGSETGKMTKLEAMVWAASHLYTLPDMYRTSVGLPFVPMKRIPVNWGNRGEEAWLWSCVDLLPNGRCGNYENRPYGPCVLYKPGTDRLCAIHPEFEPWL